MGTNVRPEVSKRKTHYISKHRYYELAHFCRQYEEWERLYKHLSGQILSDSLMDTPMKTKNTEHSDHTAKLATALAHLTEKMDLVRVTAEETDPVLGNYIFKSVTEGLSFAKLNAQSQIPANKNEFYEVYREFFWNLSKKKD